MNPGLAIKAFLKDTGRTQSFLAQKTGIDAKRLNSLLNGVRQMYVDEYYAICKALGLEIDYFVDDLKPTG